MYCPKCGKQQVSDDIRFCAKCGLGLATARKSLTAGNGLVAEERKAGLSPRAKGILQGLVIFPVGFGTWLVLDIFYEVVLSAGMLGGLYAMVTLIALVALLRILYAVVLEPGPPKPKPASLSAEAPQEISPPPTVAALSAADTGEMVQPRSVTEHTTRKLSPER